MFLCVSGKSRVTQETKHASMLQASQHPELCLAPESSETRTDDLCLFALALIMGTLVKSGEPDTESIFDRLLLFP